MLDTRLVRVYTNLGMDYGVLQIDLCMISRSWVESEVIAGVVPFVVRCPKKFWVALQKASN